MLPAGANAQYYAEDSLGSSRVVTTNTGSVCYDTDFTPFGGEKAYTSTCTQNNYKFEGKERDTETQNDDFGARYYTWRFGRWLSADWSAVPVAVPYANLTNPQTLNLYSMVADDPESSADLDGHTIGGWLNVGEQWGGCGFQGDWCDYLQGADVRQDATNELVAQLNATKQQAQRQQAQNTGTVNILGQNVPYTIAQGAPTTALATLNKIVATINGAQDQLTATQVSEIKAIKRIHIAAKLSDNTAGGESVTNAAVQSQVLHDEHLNVPIGTYIMNGANLSHASTGYWASSFVHEGVHMTRGEFGTPSNERRAYLEQYRAMPPFHVTVGEGLFIKAQCGANCN